jgi:AraC-like DNA-binding protein
MGRGVLHPDLAATRFQLTRNQPCAALAPFVDFYWILRWDLRGEPPHEQTILPHPNVNLGFEASGAGIFGVDRRLFTRTLSGSGRVLGVRFRAGGFRPFWQAPISQLTDLVVPAARLFGARAEKTRQLIFLGNSDAEMVAEAEGLLGAVLPARDALAEQAADLVACITADPALRRVDELSAASGMTVRSLQRLFADYVGVSPKWVMRRARLHEAAARADSGEMVDWAELAADLGYADQAHLTRDFTATLGVPPTQYTALAGRFYWLAGWDGAEVQRRAAAGAFERVPDVLYYLGRLGADLLGREPEHVELVHGHPPAAGQRPGMILRRHVPLLRIHLDRDT